MATKKKGGKYQDAALEELVIGSAENFGAKTDIEEVKEEIKAEVQEAAQAGRLQWIDIGLLDNNPWQPPERMSGTVDDALIALKESMIEHGFLEEYAIVCIANQNHPGRYTIVFGHRRVRAAGMADLKQVPVLVKEYSQNQLIIFNGLENILRVDFSPLDEAYSLRNFLNLKNTDGSFVYNQASLGVKIGKSRQYVGNRVGLLSLPQDLQAMIRRSPDTIRAAMYLAEVPEEEIRADLIAKVESGELTGEQIATSAQAIRGMIRRQAEMKAEHEQKQREYEEANRIQQEYDKKLRLEAAQRHQSGMEAVEDEAREANKQHTAAEEVQQAQAQHPTPIRPTPPPPPPVQQTPAQMWSVVDSRQTKSVNELKKALQALFNIKAAEEKSNTRMISGDEQDLFKSIQNYIEMLKPRFGKKGE